MTSLWSEDDKRGTYAAINWNIWSSPSCATICQATLSIQGKAWAENCVIVWLGEVYTHKPCWMYSPVSVNTDDAVQFEMERRKWGWLEVKLNELTAHKWVEDRWTQIHFSGKQQWSNRSKDRNESVDRFENLSVVTRTNYRKLFAKTAKPLVTVVWNRFPSFPTRKKTPRSTRFANRISIWIYLVKTNSRAKLNVYEHHYFSADLQKKWLVSFEHNQ